MFVLKQISRYTQKTDLPLPALLNDTLYYTQEACRGIPICDASCWWYYLWAPVAAAQKIKLETPVISLCGLSYKSGLHQSKNREDYIQSRKIKEAIWWFTPQPVVSFATTQASFHLIFPQRQFCWALSTVHSWDQSLRWETSKGLLEPLGVLPEEIVCFWKKATR